MEKMKNKKRAMIETENALLILASVAVLFVFIGAAYTGIKAIMTATKINNITQQQQSADKTTYDENNSNATDTQVTVNQPQK